MKLSEINFKLVQVQEALELDVDANDPDIYGLDVHARRRLKIKMPRGLKRKKVKRPLRTKLPYGLKRDYRGVRDDEIEE